MEADAEGVRGAGDDAAGGRIGPAGFAAAGAATGGLLAAGGLAGAGAGLAGGTTGCCCVRSAAGSAAGSDGFFTTGITWVASVSAVSSDASASGSLSKMDRPWSLMAALPLPLWGDIGTSLPDSP